MPCSVTFDMHLMSADVERERGPFVQDATRIRVWSELHDAVRYSRYFNQKASDMAPTHRFVLILHAVLAAGVLTVFIDDIPYSLVAVVSSLGIAALSMWLLLASYAEKLAAAHRICEYADNIEHQYRPYGTTLIAMQSTTRVPDRNWWR